MSHATAIKTGNRAEDTVAMHFERVGYIDAANYYSPKNYRGITQRGLLNNNFKKTLLSISEEIRAPFFIRQAKVMSTIYQVPWSMDFVAYNPDTYKDGLCVECKTQTVSGSVDEKYVFVEQSLLNVSRVNNCDTMFVLMGGLIRPCVEEYLTKSTYTTDTFQFVTNEGDLKKAIERRRVRSSVVQGSLL
jgi:hypothetical protein